jgi:tetratricopeptide (TPR) repeat protein
MIVKNESRIIKRLLDSVIKIIDCYCICDTGSTDTTKEIIREYFIEKGLPGKIIEEPFRDFGYNRNFAMKEANGMPSTHLLLIDADMIIEIDPLILQSQENIDRFKESLICDAYYVLQGNVDIQYKNVRILKNDPQYKYFGVTHEFIQTSPGTTSSDIPKNYLFIQDIGDGGSKSDKIVRDIRLLEKGLIENPNNDRYTFYLANSYRDLGNYEKAIELYKKRIELGGWKEEVWFSYYSIGNCYKGKNDMISAIHYWMESFQHHPARLESIYQIVHHYRANEKYRLANMFYNMSVFPSDGEQTDFLFAEKDIYSYKMDYEYSIISYYNSHHIPNKNKGDDVFLSFMKVLNETMTPEYIRENILSNYKFYSPKLMDSMTPIPHPYGNPMDNYSIILSRIGNISMIDREHFVSSTPSICLLLNPLTKQKEMIINLRYVNYRIDDNGNYINHEKIETKNIIAVMEYEVDKERRSINCRKKKEFELNYNRALDNRYIGVEDIRLVGTLHGELVYNANRVLENRVLENRVLENGSIFAVEHGYINLLSGTTYSSSIIRSASQKAIEKNWVIFMNSDQKIKIIYQWHPLTIGDVVENYGNEMNFETTHQYETPLFMKLLRGSTNGIHVGEDEIWFICHIVSYENRRHYYHVLVILDKTTFKLKRYTRPFTFEGKVVEYTLGFVYFEEISQFIIGYSVMDNTTKYMMVSKEVFDDMIIYVSP